MLLRIAPPSPSSSHSALSWPVALWRLLVLSSLSSVLLMADDFIQQCFTTANQAELELRFVVVVWLFALGLWLCGMPRLVAALLLMLASMQLIQLSHVSFFGEPLAAPDILSLFADFAEVRETGWASFADHWHVLPSVLLPYGLLLALHLWLPRHLRLPRSRWAVPRSTTSISAARTTRATSGSSTWVLLPVLASALSPWGRNSSFVSNGVPAAKCRLPMRATGWRRPWLTMMPISSASAAGRSPEAPSAEA